MANVENSRDRLLCVLNILATETDMNHGLTIKEITAKLKDFGFEPDRKTLYSDFRAITERYAMVEKTGGNVPKYFIEERSFEVEEIMVLIDAVESAGFMTQSKKEELIKKLKGLTSVKNAAELTSQIHYIGRHHSTNNEYIYTVSAIRRAMAEGHPVTFKYLDYEFGVGQVEKYGGMDYVVHPLAMVWSDGFYYCIGTQPERYPDTPEKPFNFRIDRMKHASVKEDVKMGPRPKDFDVARYMEASFSMFGSHAENVVLRFKKNKLAQFYDHFDQTVSVFEDPDNKEYARASVTVNVGPTFYAWVSTYRGDFTILEPKSIRKAYHDHLKKALEA